MILNWNIPSLPHSLVAADYLAAAVVRRVFDARLVTQHSRLFEVGTLHEVLEEFWRNADNVVTLK
jgi:hypothetical protein